MFISNKGLTFFCGVQPKEENGPVLAVLQQKTHAGPDLRNRRLARKTWKGQCPAPQRTAVHHSGLCTDEGDHRDPGQGRWQGPKGLHWAAKSAPGEGQSHERTGLVRKVPQHGDRPRAQRHPDHAPPCPAGVPGERQDVATPRSLQHGDQERGWGTRVWAVAAYPGHHGKAYHIKCIDHGSSLCSFLTPSQVRRKWKDLVVVNALGHEFDISKKGSEEGQDLRGTLQGRPKTTVRGHRTSLTWSTARTKGAMRPRN